MLGIKCKDRQCTVCITYYINLSKHVRFPAVDVLLSQSNSKNNMSFDQVAVHVLVQGDTALFKIQLHCNHVLRCEEEQAWLNDSPQLQFLCVCACVWRSSVLSPLKH